MTSFVEKIINLFLIKSRNVHASHNLSEEGWETQRQNIEPWGVHNINSSQKTIQSVISKMTKAKIGNNCFIASDCNFYTDRATLGNSVKLGSLVTLSRVRSRTFFVLKKVILQP